MFVIIKSTLLGNSLVIKRRENVGFTITYNLEHAKKFNTKKSALDYVKGHNAKNSVIVMSEEEYKNKIDR